MASPVGCVNEVGHYVVGKESISELTSQFLIVINLPWLRLTFKRPNIVIITYDFDKLISSFSLLKYIFS